MSLFQHSVLKKYLADLPQDKLNAAWVKFTTHFQNPTIQQNILNAKEEEYQEGFVRDLFVIILGYTLKPQPDFNLVMEQKSTSDSTKSDGAILSATGAVVAVIELKDTKTTDLSKVEKQAFSYKHQHKDCRYVITSNFQQLRLYINDAIDSETFDLFRLTKESFALLYCCLHQQALQNDVPLRMKQQSVAEEENVTKKLYADYDRFRKQLFGNIKAQNPQYNKLDLFKKTQKLLDRFLFILFAEDRLLLPPNSVREILKQWEALRDMDQYVPLYDRFRKYFGYMNTGYQGKQFEIFAYNGGLFTPDEILDNITIDDQLLYDSCMGLSNYDFESEVDVNILGHIFEHSLTEIERIEQELANEAEAIEEPQVKYNTKRKKDGVFYTPRYITKYIVENTVGALCTQKWEEFKIDPEDYNAKKSKAEKQKLLQKLDDYRQWLLELTICDPACGSGAFLNQALEFLIQEHHRVDVLKARLFGTDMIMSDVETSILENNLYGVDINEEATDIAKLSLWLRTAKKGRKLNSLNEHIKSGNSLIDDPVVAGDKAFNWQQEFPEVFAKGGFDVVIGNPPYVFARDKISESDKSFYNKNYFTALYQVNTYILFIERTVQLVKRHGVFGLIVPNAWLMVSSGANLREYLLKNVSLTEIINLMGYSFEDVSVETIILMARKIETSGNKVVIKMNNRYEFFESNIKDQDGFKSLEGFEFNVFTDAGSEGIVAKMKVDSLMLDDIASVKAGLKAYQTGKGKPKQTPDVVENRPFDYKYKFDENTYEYLEGKDVLRYAINWNGQYLRFGPHLAEPRMFVGPKIIMREITAKFPRSLISTFTEQPYLFNISNVAIVSKPNSEYSLKFICALLNSSLLSFYFQKNTPKSNRQMFPKIILQDLKRFPIKQTSKDIQNLFVEKVDILLSKNNELLVVIHNVLKLLKSKYQNITLNKKLENWPSITSAEFIREVDKFKIKLSLQEQSQWMQYFEAEKAKANAIQDQINKTDKEIDAMVYALYGLTEEEIKIVEQG